MARNLTLLTDFYELTMMQGYLKSGKHQEKVIFDMFYRKNPCGNGFAICCGLEQVVEYIRNLNFNEEDIDYLRSLGSFDEDFIEYLRGFGCSMQPMFISLVGICLSRVFYVVVLFPMEFFHGLRPLYMSYPVSWTLTSLALWMMYRYIRKQYPKSNFS